MASATHEFLGDKESLQQLESLIEPEHDRAAYAKYGHQRLESCFDGRLFLVYSPLGLNAERTHRDPEIHTTLKLIKYTHDSRKGAEVVLEDLQTGGMQTIGYIPTRVFDYDVFMSVPPFMRLRWDGKPMSGPSHPSEQNPWPNGVKRTLSYALLIKCRNRSDFYSKSNHYCETPNNYRRLFPDTKLELQFA